MTNTTITYTIIKAEKIPTGSIEYHLHITPEYRPILFRGHISTTGTFYIDEIGPCQPDELLMAAAYLMTHLDEVVNSIQTVANNA